MRQLSTTGTTRAYSAVVPTSQRVGTKAGRLPKAGRVRSPDSPEVGAGRPMESLAQRCAARRERIVVHRAKDHADADQWDLEFWQNQTPAMRLLALVELRNDLGKVRGRNRMFDDE